MKFLLVLILLVGCYDGKTPVRKSKDLVSVKQIDSTSEEWAKELCKCGYQPEGIIFDESEPTSKEELDELLFEIDRRDKERLEKAKKLKRKKVQ